MSDHSWEQCFLIVGKVKGKPANKLDSFIPQATRQIDKELTDDERRTTHEFCCLFQYSLAGAALMNDIMIRIRRRAAQLARTAPLN